MKKILLVTFVLLTVSAGLICGSTRFDSRVVPPLTQEAESNTEWVARCLKEMETIKKGMSRGDLLKVFTTEGGLSTGLQRTYVYRLCPYFKVDVEFKPVRRSARTREGRVTLTEVDEDVITKISRPYIAWSVAD